ncbi:MAG: IS4 family transposase [Gammaproteobacteria bacterium]|nr:IS4 family transposase [Gammaproteobacteria bacterium]
MNTGRTIFSQVMDFLPHWEFRKCVKRYQGDCKIQKFSCMDQFLCMAFAQLTYRESLRDIEVCLRGNLPKLYHMGIRSRVARSTLADANENRDWRIYADFAQILISVAKDLYAKEDFGINLQTEVYAFDSTTIDLCLSLFPWARFRKTKGAIKLHTLLNLRGSIPEFIHISDGKLHDVNVLDILIVQPGSFYLIDRGYVDFARLYTMQQASAFFVTRCKRNFQCQRRYSYPVDKSTGLRCDQTIILTGANTSKDYPMPLRRIRYYDAETDKSLTFITNNFTLPALIIAQLYKARWQVELFFKWIKQHLRIKSFYGTSANAVKTQVWIAVSVYVLVAILKKRLDLDQSLYTILQFLSVSIFEKTPISEAFLQEFNKTKTGEYGNQLLLFDL